MKSYTGISRDHSGSMQGLASKALQDYNQNIDSIRKGAIEHGIDTIVSVVECGGGVRDVVVNSSVTSLKPIAHYPTPGRNTPLFKSVERLIELLERAPDAGSDDVSFLIMAITDGQDNIATHREVDELVKKIRLLQMSDRWTFVFRVPVGYASHLSALGIPRGNIQEWNQTEKGFEEATQVTTQSFGNYYSGLSRGIKSTSKFFTNIDTSVMKQEIKKLDDVSSQCSIVKIERRNNIKDFIEGKFKRTYVKGTAFYELQKTEKVQPQKQIAIRDKTSGKVFTGYQARGLLGLPRDTYIKLVPGYNGNYEIFIQSTSSNRILNPGTQVLYWPNKI